MERGRGRGRVDSRGSPVCEYSPFPFHDLSPFLYISSHKVIRCSGSSTACVNSTYFIYGEAPRDLSLVGVSSSMVVEKFLFSF